MSAVFIYGAKVGAWMGLSSTLLHRSAGELYKSGFGDAGLLAGKVLEVALPIIIFAKAFMHSELIQAFPIPSIAGVVIGGLLIAAITDFALDALGICARAPVLNRPVVVTTVP